MEKWAFVLAFFFLMKGYGKRAVKRPGWKIFQKNFLPMRYKFLKMIRRIAGVVLRHICWGIPDPSTSCHPRPVCGWERVLARSQGRGFRKSPPPQAEQFSSRLRVCLWASAMVRSLFWDPRRQQASHVAMRLGAPSPPPPPPAHSHVPPSEPVLLFVDGFVNPHGLPASRPDMSQLT